jgi:predicted porin
MKQTTKSPAALRLSFALGVLGVGMTLAPNAMAVDFGPFTLTGFAKAEVSRASNQCSDCQAIPGEVRHRPWADDLAEGKAFGTRDGKVTLFQPYLGTKEFDLGGGFKAKGLISQRWRDGKEDIPGIWYEKNATLLHENYGSVQVGAFPTRSWSLADYPYGTEVGIADSWASSGAGYGLLQRAVRVGLPLMDVAQGDLHVELTYDAGDSNYKVNKPALYELYAKYVKGPLIVDAVAQSGKNGQAVAWGHAPFVATTTSVPFKDNQGRDLLADDNQQSMFMLMARYQLNVKTDLYAGVRYNRWSGSNAVPSGWLPIAGHPNGGVSLYDGNNMFNVDGAQGYSASSTDISLGLRYKFAPKWNVNTGLVYLGKASTSNPKDRGQSNTMLLNTFGVGYEIQPGFSVYGFAGLVNYGKKGLAPLSMPGHAAFTGVDSRVAKSGNWMGAGLVYTF